MKIYVASSWRNLIYPGIVLALRRCGHDVYDFRNPPNKSGFGWEQVNPAYQRGGLASVEDYRTMLAHPIVAAGYESDIGAVRAADCVVYVLPCGRSASFEFGYAMGMGKPGYVVWFGDHEPDLMFRGAKILGTMNDLFDVFGEPLEEGTA